MLTYANQLTILRMIFAPCFVLLLVYGYPRTATLIFLLAGVTDGLDGLIARKLEQKTSLGSFLDPMADKLLLTTAFVTLTIPSVPTGIHIPLWLTILIISRDVLIALSALIIHLRTGHTKFPPSLLGKCTTATQLVVVSLVLLVHFIPNTIEPLFEPAVWLTAAFTIGSGLHYFHRSVKLIESYQKVERGDGEGRDQNC